MRLLRHPAHPRRARFRADGGTGGGGAQTRGPRREGTDRHRAGHDLLRARPLREAPPGRTAAPPVPHRRHRVDTPPLRLSHGIPRRGDRSHGIRAQDLQIPRHPVPAHLRRTALGHAPPPHQGRSLCAGRKIAGAIPDLALRTTLLVGYPGETEADFTELEQFVRDVRFERLGVFAYSEEEGTYSARELADDVRRRSNSSAWNAS